MSVGHVSRILEEAGIATVIIAVRAFRDCLDSMKVPRAVITHNVMGRPLGRPGHADQQRAAVVAALELLASAAHGGTIVEIARG